MKLCDTIAKLEAKIPQLQGIEQLALYIQLCEHLVLVNSHKLNMYCTKVLNSTQIDAKHTLMLQAKLYKAGLLMNQLDMPNAVAMLESIKGDVMGQSDKVLYIDWLRHYALAMVYSGKSDEGIATIEQCMTMCTDMVSPVTKSFVYSFASVCFYERDLVKSGTYAMQGLTYANISGKKWLIGYATLMLGYWTRENKMKEKTLVNFLATADILKDEGADEYYAYTLTQLSMAYKDQNQFDVAIQLLYTAKNILALLQNQRLLINVNYSIGRCYRLMRETQKAEKYFEEALQIATAEKNKQEMAFSNVFLAYLYRDTNDIHKAIAHIETAIALFGENFRPSSKADLYKHLHPMYRQIGDTEKAYTTLLTYTDIRFKLQDENRIKEASLLQEKYEAEKREAELKESKLQHAESELKALKAQMNPHFIFNSLNSIQEIFFLGDKQLANEHLSRFSQLMRNILKASGRTLITLHEEIQMLEEYLALEALRFGADFSFNIRVDDNVDIYTLDVPPMIIQPFVENAVKHGLQHKDGQKQLNISFGFDEENNLINAVVADNGIGRKASAVINERRSGHHSFATSATARRFQILNNNEGDGFNYRYTDNIDEAGNATGTTVYISIPDMFI